MDSVVLASETEEVSGLSILIPPLYEVFWAAVVLLILWMILGRWALPVLYSKIDERQEQIDQGLDAAEIAKANAAAAERGAAEIVRKANEEARKVREDAAADAARIVAEATDKARAESARLTEITKRQLAAEKAALEQDLRKDVGELATQLAEQIVGEALKDPELAARVTDRFMDQLEAELRREPVGAIKK